MAQVELDDIVMEFLVESHENLDQLDQDLVALEREPGSRELLGSIFRTIHTIKGTCGFLAFTRLEALTHIGENLLSRLRDGALVLTPDRASLLLQMVDGVRALLRGIEQTGIEPELDQSALCAALTAALEADTAIPVQRAPEVLAPEPEPEPAPEARTTPVAEPEPVVAAPVEVETPPVAVVEPPAAVVVEERREDGDRRQGDRRAAGEDHPAGRPLVDSTIRVDVGLLDALMTLVGELVLTRNQLMQFATAQDDMALLRVTQRLNLISGELQEGVMKTRMQPIDTVWSKLPRVVRDLGVSCGKSVRLEMEGKDTELDKTLLEAVKDPITHLVRNAVDHGIETAEVRRAAGKPDEGRLLLRAYHESGQVNVEITDDGKGIDCEVIRAKAVQRGLVTAAQAERMSEREVQALIFHPGFSTAAAVTNVSGRGVGMDVVKTNVERIGGAVDVQSTFGRGTTIRVRIPLTLAIIPALLVEEGEERYAIPQASVLELVRLEPEQLATTVEFVAGTPVHRLRGQLLPLVSLAALLGSREDGLRDIAQCTQALNIVVLQSDDRQFGLVVPGVNDTQEIVVKPLGRQLKDVGIFSGATIMGDGRVALILDVSGLAAATGIVREREEVGGSHVVSLLGGEEQTRVAHLVFCAGGRRLAVPLSTVSRLEELMASQVELAGSKPVLQYRGGILPLVELERVDPARVGPLPVVVCRDGEQAVGLVVGEILDVVEGEDLSGAVPSDGCLGSLVLQERVTDVLDVPALLRRHAPVPQGAGHV
jgi:two-component system chemotaxis sensor kinase CheA